MLSTEGILKPRGPEGPRRAEVQVLASDGRTDEEMIYLLAWNVIARVNLEFGTEVPSGIVTAMTAHLAIFSAPLSIAIGKTSTCIPAVIGHSEIAALEPGQ